MYPTISQLKNMHFKPEKGTKDISINNIGTVHFCLPKPRQTEVLAILCLKNFIVVAFDQVFFILSLSVYYQWIIDRLLPVSQTVFKFTLGPQQNFLSKLLGWKLSSDSPRFKALALRFSAKRKLSSTAGLIKQIVSSFYQA